MDTKDANDADAKVAALDGKKIEIFNRKKWELKHFPLGIFQYGLDSNDISFKHTANNTLQLIKKVLEIFKLDTDFLDSSTQDTTGFKFIY